ncbi:hypothetical protein NC653_032442 [Populus alba x Populus x berolinensis]|uniref:Uncharacterized protein n=1 Tax=Populus alba x Populus x berolinensis TaxID=444605 RepID=A0AAD6PZ55_9ROSI|nr:hypothetical protein NC653_032442 [Populus alba x Populus x berolinensis]
MDFIVEGRCSFPCHSCLLQFCCWTLPSTVSVLHLFFWLLIVVSYVEYFSLLVSYCMVMMSSISE